MFEIWGKVWSMSRFVRKQMLSIVEQLKIAAGRVGADDDSAALLADCQQAAVILGTRLEKIRGEGTRTVAELEAYCEELYQAGEALAGQNHAAEEAAESPEKHGAEEESAGSTEKQTGEESAECFGCNLEDIRAQLARRLDAVETYLKEDMPDRLEVVFLPYNASMWDSLESVWMAARDDADCDAYVIPIPYYDRKKDASLGEFHYEGDQLPDGVPITHYDAYDLETRHPDVIYIHNPYDELNILTSVDSRFYSRRIRFFTEKLVYLPYFVLEEPDVDSEASLDSIEHFITTPGVYYADQVILQSENMRNAYIKIYTRELKRRRVSFNTPDIEKKFLGTGSPKFDRIGKVAVDFEQLPEKWRNLLKKPDGTRKKVIFYNTSVGAMLKAGPMMLTKIRNVLDVFRTYRDEVVLLWRPHPLIKVTFEVVYPDFWNKYRKIVEAYVQEGWGIYDDSSDLDRAIALADAYYGDGSSVVQLCQKAGMPIMIQNPDVIGNA
jgi:hypothetical protein